MFYLLANQFDERLGLFVLRVNEYNPSDYKFLIKLKNKLDIGDADLFVLRDKELQYKELVVSYKAIFINTYNIFIFDISSSSGEHLTLFRHESFQLWESKIQGFMMNKSKDFVVLSRKGMNVFSLGSVQKKTITGPNNQLMMVHSFESMNYLKIHPRNCIHIDFSGSKQIVTIQQQYTKKNNLNEETKFDTIYRIRIHEITLRELLLLQSISLSKTLSDILTMVVEQPNASLFYKTFLELDNSNMVSILSFDSRTMKILLDSKNQEFFQEEFPIFFKNKIVKSNNPNSYFYRSAIDNSLANNQIIAVGYIINYIVRFQNNYVSSFLFNKNFPKLMQKGINVSPILESKIFRYQFYFDEWPSTHYNNNEAVKPYNGTVFELRQNYNSLFPEFPHKFHEGD